MPRSRPMSWNRSMRLSRSRSAIRSTRAATSTSANDVAPDPSGCSNAGAGGIGEATAAQVGRRRHRSHQARQQQRMLRRDPFPMRRTCPSVHAFRYILGRCSSSTTAWCTAAPPTTTRDQARGRACTWQLLRRAAGLCFDNLSIK